MQAHLPSILSAAALALALVASGIAASPSRAAEGPLPLAHAHSHNDYEHHRPLLDALDQGFCSVEADIYLIDGQLLVAHDRPDTRAERTLQSLYLDPLKKRVLANGGRVFPGGPPFSLLIDIKDDAAATYTRLRQVLVDYRDILTSFRPDRTERGAITIVLSGNRPTAMVEAEPIRWVGIDGRVPDLEANPNPHLVPLVSDHWGTHFRWKGEGAFPEDEAARLSAWVEQAHRQGRRLRFWGAPDRPEIWRVQANAGVDLVNTDRLAELAAFLRHAPAP